MSAVKKKRSTGLGGVTRRRHRHHHWTPRQSFWESAVLDAIRVQLEHSGGYIHAAGRAIAIGDAVLEAHRKRFPSPT
jgi:hypothetical protein